MVRLQRVTFLALHNYLGLTNELFSHVSVWGGSLLENVFFSVDPPKKGGRSLVLVLLTRPPCRRCSRCASSRSPATPPAPAPCATASGGSAPPKRAGKGKRSWVGARMGRTDPPQPPRPPQAAAGGRSRPSRPAVEPLKAGALDAPAPPLLSRCISMPVDISGGSGAGGKGGGPWGCESPPWGRESHSGLPQPPQGSCNHPRGRAHPPRVTQPPPRIMQPPLRIMHLPHGS